MLNSERPQAETLIAALLAGFDRKATPDRLEAYWRGCNRMPLPLLERVVDRVVGDEGPDEIPSPKRLWGIARDLRRSAPTPGQGSTLSAQQCDAVHALAQSCLLAFLLGHGGLRDGHPASQASLAAMIDAKNAIAAAARNDEVLTRVLATHASERTADEVAVIGEWREVLMSAFAKLWQERTPEESACDLEHYVRTGRCRDGTLEASAALA